MGEVADEFLPKGVRLPQVGDFVDLGLRPRHHIAVDLLDNVVVHVEVDLVARPLEPSNGLVEDADPILDVHPKLPEHQHVAKSPYDQGCDGRQPPLTLNAIGPKGTPHGKQGQQTHSHASSDGHGSGAASCHQPTNL